MPEVDNIRDAAVVFISTEIGRGHPGYLDGLVDTIRSDFPHIPFIKTDVFSLSEGISLAAWKAVRRMYHIGGKGGLISSAYGRLRQTTGGAQGGGPVRMLGRDLRRRLSQFAGLVVVAHPLVARILAPGHDVIYQHGELAAPAESFIHGCRKIFVPFEETAERFMQADFTDDDLLVTGQCIETALVAGAQDAFKARLERLGGDRPLTVALFSSGAYPRDHMARLRRAAISLAGAGYEVYLFAGLSKRMADGFSKYFENAWRTGEIERSAFERLRVIRSADRADENRKVAEIFPRFDLFIAPAHERINWAVGLGLPQIILTPHIGSYALLNAHIAIERDVGMELAASAGEPSTAEIVNRLHHNGRLRTMAENGFGRTAIDGFDRAARFIAENCLPKK